MGYVKLKEIHIVLKNDTKVMPRFMVSPEYYYSDWWLWYILMKLLLGSNRFVIDRHVQIM